MNTPSASDLRVESATLEEFATRLGEAAGMTPAQAALLARLLTANDRRGVVSHGTVQLATYARLLRDGQLNPRPRPSVVRESGATLLVDGDGGLGYFPAYEGTEQLVEKATANGVAVLVTRNHGHIGAAGLYARLTLGHELLCFVTSGHQLELSPGDPVTTAAGGSPMAFSAPTRDEPPLVLDFGVLHDLYVDAPHREEILALAPGLVHRAIGLGTVCQSWGGFLAGVPLDPHRADRRWPGANQGSMVIALRIADFLPVEEFTAEMDGYVQAVATLAPLHPGEANYLPGGVEAAREHRAFALGVPLGAQHRARLTEVAAEFGVPVPWA